ncbi:MAG: Maf family protein [Patescibacteria group bacterium]|jgi:septum formation protein
MKLILGSSSKYRQQVLREAGIVFEVMKPEIDEKAIRFADPDQLVLAVANAKADALLAKIKEPAILITSDQVVLCEGKIREKAESREEAERFLKSYITHPLEVANGIVVVNTATGKRVQTVHRESISYDAGFAEVIPELLEAPDTMHCAGAIMTEHPLARKHIAMMTGTQAGFMGMPLDVVRGLIKNVEEVC